MSRKPTDPLDRLPSVSELLENPQIRILAERVNRSAVVHGVRSFLEDLRVDLANRLGDAPLPKFSELADLAARYVLRPPAVGPRPIINATGRVVSDEWASVPMAASAQQAVVGISQHFSIAHTQAGSRQETDDAHATLLCQLTGAEAAATVHSYESALWLVCAGLAAHRHVVVARSELGRLARGLALADLITAAGAHLMDVGSATGASLAEYERATEDAPACLWRVRSDQFRIVGDVDPVDPHALMTLAHGAGATYVEALDGAPLVAGALFDGQPPSNAAATQPATQAELGPGKDADPAAGDARTRIAAGVDLIVCRGDGFLGGPPCGILLGKRRLLRQITEHPAYATCLLDPIRGAMLDETLRCWVPPPGRAAEPAAPVARLLSAPLENLRHRAGRIAEQVTGTPALAVVETLRLESFLTASGAPQLSVASWGIALTPADGDVRRLASRLEAADLPVFGRPEDDRFLLDLRTILPEQDASLVAALVAVDVSPGSRDN